MAMSLTDWLLLFLLADGLVTKLALARANGRMADRLLVLIDPKASDALTRLRAANPVVRDEPAPAQTDGATPRTPLWTKDFGNDLPSDTRVDGA